MRQAASLAGWLVLVATVAAAQGPPPPPPPLPPGAPRDGAAPVKTGTSALRGRVLSLETGKPLRRAQVRVGGSEREGRSVSTDENGVWELRELPAGRYTIQVSKGGYVSLAYGQRRPFEQGKPVELADAETVDKLDVSLPRGSVITGRVFDEFGEPVSGARVMAMRYRYVGGSRSLFAIGGGDLTDDIGQYRLHGLAPGEYYLSTSSGSSFTFERSDDRTAYAPTYYPGTPVVSEAQKIPVALGQEVQGITISLAPVKVATIAGSVMTSSGKPMASGMVMLVSTGGPGPISKTALTRADGTFTLSNVIPGEYTLQTQMMDLDAVATTGRVPSPIETASMPLSVSGQNISGIALATAPAASASGTVTFVGGVPAGVAPSAVSLGGTSPNPAGFSNGGRFTVGADWTFEARGLSGVLMIRGGAAGGWTIKSVVLNGTDVTDTGIVFKPGEDVKGIEITLTKETGSLSGTVTGTKNEAVTEYVTVAFPPDSAKWGYMSRFVRTARPDQSGKFILSGLPAGDYLVAAVDYLEPGEEQDPEVLERLRSVATPVSWKDGEQKTVTIKIGNPG